MSFLPSIHHHLFKSYVRKFRSQKNPIFLCEKNHFWNWLSMVLTKFCKIGVKKLFQTKLLFKIWGYCERKKAELRKKNWAHWIGGKNILSNVLTTLHPRNHCIMWSHFHIEIENEEMLFGYCYHTKRLLL